MSENIFPAEPVQGTADVVEENYSAKSISELSDLFDGPPVKSPSA